MKLCSEYEIVVEYGYYDIVNHYVQKNKIPIKKVEYDQKICINIVLEKSKEKGILAEITEITDRSAQISNIDTYYYT